MIANEKEVEKLEQKGFTVGPTYREVICHKWSPEKEEKLQDLIYALREHASREELKYYLPYIEEEVRKC